MCEREKERMCPQQMRQTNIVSKNCVEICTSDWIMDLFAMCACACGSFNIVGTKIKETKSIGLVCGKVQYIQLTKHESAIRNQCPMRYNGHLSALFPASLLLLSRLSFSMQVFGLLYLIFCVSPPHTESCVNRTLPEHWLHRRFCI